MLVRQLFSVMATSLQWLDTLQSERFKCGLQQLYLFGGLLVLLAIINIQPLSTVGHIAEIGTVWHVAGNTLLLVS